MDPVLTAHQTVLSSPRELLKGSPLEILREQLTTPEHLRLLKKDHMSDIQELEAELADLKAERDSLEQRVIYLSSSIRIKQEELHALYLKRKS